MKKLAWILPILLAFLFVPLWAMAQQGTTKKSAPVAPAEKSEHKHPGATTGTAKDQEAMKEKCKEMMAKQEQFQTDMKAMDARLDEKLAAMNAATGDEKMAAMEGVINEMAAQRKETREKLGAMHHGGGMCAMMGKGCMGAGMMGGGGMGDMSKCGGMMKNHGHGAGGPGA